MTGQIGGNWSGVRDNSIRWMCAVGMKPMKFDELNVFEMAAVIILRSLESYFLGRPSTDLLTNVALDFTECTRLFDAEAEMNTYCRIHMQSDHP